MAAERFRSFRLIAGAFKRQDRFAAFQVWHHVNHLQAFGGDIHRGVGNIEPPTLQTGDQIRKTGIGIHRLAANGFSHTGEKLNIKTGRLVVLHIFIRIKGHIRTGGNFPRLQERRKSAERGQGAGGAKKQSIKSFHKKPPGMTLHAGKIVAGLLNEE